MVHEPVTQSVELQDAPGNVLIVELVKGTVQVCGVEPTEAAVRGPLLEPLVYDIAFPSLEMVLLVLEGILERATQASEDGTVGEITIVVIISALLDLGVRVKYSEDIFRTVRATVEQGGPRDWLDMLHVESG